MEKDNKEFKNQNSKKQLSFYQDQEFKMVTTIILDSSSSFNVIHSIIKKGSELTEVVSLMIHLNKSFVDF